MFLENGVAFSTGETIIAPGDAEIISVSGDSVTLKFKSLSDATVERLKTQFGTDYKDPKKRHSIRYDNDYIWNNSDYIRWNS